MKIDKIIRALARAFSRTFSPKVPFISFISVDMKEMDVCPSYRQIQQDLPIFEVAEISEERSITEGYEFILEEPVKGLQFKNARGFSTRSIHRIAVNDEIDALDQVESEDLEENSLQSEIFSSTSSEEFLLLS